MIKKHLLRELYVTYLQIDIGTLFKAVSTLARHISIHTGHINNKIKYK